MRRYTPVSVIFPAACHLKMFEVRRCGLTL
jgi:hypothetical protein